MLQCRSENADRPPAGRPPAASAATAPRNPAAAAVAAAAATAAAAKLTVTGAEREVALPRYAGKERCTSYEVQHRRKSVEDHAGELRHHHNAEYEQERDSCNKHTVSSPLRAR